MTDTIIEAIRAGTIHTGNISFDRLRGAAARDHDLWRELGRGRAVLSSQQQLDQYLYSYGPMTRNQWGQFLGGVSLPTGPLRVVDYGCGQGLAFALLFDRFGTEVIERVQESVLIEPSAMALARAKSVFSCYCENTPIYDLNKKLDDLTPGYLRTGTNLSTIHLFSNVLDIDDFDYGSLFTKMFRNIGHHSVLAVSHRRDFDGGSDRFRNINQQITNPLGNDYFYVSKSEIAEFNTAKGQSAISWQLHFEVLYEPV